MPLKSALLRDFGGCCFAVTLLKVAFMVIRGDLYFTFNLFVLPLPAILSITPF